MKILLSCLLAVAIATLPYEVQAQEAPPDPGPEPEFSVAVCLLIVVVVVGGVIVYVVKRSTACVKQQRCSECSRLLPLNVNTCPTCGTVNVPAPPPQQNSIEGWQYPETMDIQLSSGDGQWTTITTQPWDINTQVTVQIEQAETLQGWIDANSEIAPPVILSTNATGTCSLFRVVENYP